MAGAGDPDSSGRTEVGRKRRGRGSITTDEILDGAFELAELHSVEKFTMTMLSKHLGVGSTSIYWYYRGKEPLLEAMTVRALERFHLGAPFDRSGRWQDMLRGHAHRLLSLLRNQPVLADLIVFRTAHYGVSVRQVAYRQMEGAIAHMVSVGFSPEDAIDTYEALSLLTSGAAIINRLAGDGGQEDLGSDSVLDPDATPLLHALETGGHRIAVPNDRCFELGVDAIIEYAERLLRRASQAADRGHESVDNPEGFNKGPDRGASAGPIPRKLTPGANSPFLRVR